MEVLLCTFENKSFAKQLELHLADSTKTRKPALLPTLSNVSYRKICDMMAACIHFLHFALHVKFHYLELTLLSRLLQWQQSFLRQPLDMVKSLDNRTSRRGTTKPDKAATLVYWKNNLSSCSKVKLRSYCLNLSQRSRH